MNLTVSESRVEINKDSGIAIVKMLKLLVYSITLLINILAYVFRIEWEIIEHQIEAAKLSFHDLINGLKSLNRNWIE